jgi:peptidyl-prolyl cis-trans isomerase C
MRRILREPLVHFLLLGALLFALDAALNRSDPGGEGGGDAGATEIVVRSADLDRVRAAAAHEPGPSPTAAELVRRHVREEALYREALALGLDKGDPVVRRRLVDKMAFLSRQLAVPPEPPAAELRQWFEQHRDRYQQPARIWFRQLFFDERRRGSRALADANAALASLETAGAEVPPDGAGDQVVIPRALADRAEPEIATLLGASFASGLFAAPVGRWHGPLRSPLGLHLVRVSRREPARLPTLEEIREQVQADLLAQRLAGTDADRERELIARYKVTLAPEVQRQVGGAR